MRWTLPLVRQVARSRQRGQDLVEYGLIVACVAFGAVLGWNVLSASEANYFNGMPLSPDAPAAPGALLHVTSTTVTCNPDPVHSLIVTQITCVATVQDDFANASDRKPPWGAFDWTFADGSTQTCSLPSPPSGYSATCSATYIAIADRYIPGTYPLSARYRPTSNHFPSMGSSSITVLQPDLLPNCVSGQVELGRPVDCRVTLISGGYSIPSKQIIWEDAGTAPSVGIFTCRTQGTGYNIWTSPECLPPFDKLCTTDASGACEVIYRRLWDLGGGGIGAKPVLSATLTYLDGSSTTVNNNAIAVVAPTSVHGTAIAAVCSPTSGSATVNKTTLADGNASFNTTADISINSGGTAQFSCAVSVLDTQPNPATSNANPDVADAFPPLGSVAVLFNGSAVGNCAVLLPASTGASPPAQAAGQEPFFATCTPNVFTVTDSTPPPGSGTLQFVFGAEPAHAASTLDVPVTFK